MSTLRCHCSLRVGWDVVSKREFSVAAFARTQSFPATVHALAVWGELWPLNEASVEQQNVTVFSVFSVESLMRGRGRTGSWTGVPQAQESTD